MLSRQPLATRACRQLGFATSLTLALVLLCQCSDDSGLPSYAFDDAKPLHTEFSATNAYAHCADMVNLGPRPAGSPAAERCRQLLEKELEAAGWTTLRDSFVNDTPSGEITFVNLRARFASNEEGVPDWESPIQVLVGSHYDTKYFQDIRFVGANDGGSSTAVLMELARAAATRPDFARRLELVFFDGEEALERYTPTDGLYGSRHYAQTITRRQPINKRPEAVVIVDMVGDPDLVIKTPADTPQDLVEKLASAADDLDVKKHVGRWSTNITDDHVPFQNEGVPAIDLIDLDFKPWHTSGDTMKKVSEESLGISGRLTVHFLERYLISSPPPAPPALKPS